MKTIISILAVIAACTFAAPAMADQVRNPNCTTVIDQQEQTIHHDAVTHDVVVVDVEAVAGFWANFAPNETRGPFEGTPTYPVDAGGTWIVHTEGGPGQDESGVFQIGNGHGDWFYRQQAVAEVSHTETVVDAEAYDEVIPAVTHQECDDDDGGPTPPPPPPPPGDEPTPGPVNQPKLGKNDLPYTGQPLWLTLLEALVGATILGAGTAGKVANIRAR